MLSQISLMKNRWVLRVALEPGENLFFDLAAPTTGNRKGSSLVKWRPDEGTPAEARWKYDFEDARREDRAIIDAGVYEQNSFLGLSIYHCIQSRKGLPKSVDLRVKAS